MESLVEHKKEPDIYNHDSLFVIFVFCSKTTEKSDDHISQSGYNYNSSGFWWIPVWFFLWLVNGFDVRLPSFLLVVHGLHQCHSRSLSGSYLTKLSSSTSKISAGSLLNTIHLSPMWPKAHSSHTDTKKSSRHEATCRANCLYMEIWT